MTNFAFIGRWSRSSREKREEIRHGEQGRINFKSWAERAYLNNLIYYNRLDRGGHFASWEQPQLFSEDASRLQVATQVTRVH
jgi:hypothetical protein